MSAISEKRPLLESECRHTSVSGETPENTVCNHCLHEEGDPTQWARDNARTMQKLYYQK